MKYTITINQNRSVEWKLTASESIVFSWIYELPSWADKMEYNGITYYFGSRNVACKELPIISDKADTMYRLYKSLEKKGLISTVVLQKKDYIAVTEKGKNWHYEIEHPKDGNKSEECRNEIPESTEINPTNKYTNNQDTSNKEVEVEKKGWRDSFEVYLGLVNTAKERLLNDTEYRQYIEKYYPNADYDATLNKLIDSFWGKQEGWEHNKNKKKCKTINMFSALKNNMDKRERIVYKQKQIYNNTKKPVYSQNRKETLKPDMPILNEDGDLLDGTFFKGGARWYVSEIDAKPHSIPIKAPQRPDKRYEWDSVNNRWYLPVDKWSASDELW